MDGTLLEASSSLITQLNENTEIQFPVGSWSIDMQKLERVLRKANLSFPDSVSFTGQGKSKTTVTISDAEFTSRDLNNLCFRDMTIDCVNDAMLDKRQGSLTLRLDNVRLVRFDAGHGGCRLLRVNDGIIVHAIDTDFVGGFGRSPGNGDIFASSDVFLGHFENCSFRGIKYDLFRSIRSRQSQIWMDNCKFDRAYQPNPCVVLKDCDSNVVFRNVNWAPNGE